MSTNGKWLANESRIARRVASLYHLQKLPIDYGGSQNRVGSQLGVAADGFGTTRSNLGDGMQPLLHRE
jgi:hypothetical protein